MLLLFNTTCIASTPIHGGRYMYRMDGGEWPT
jgi:hypothetical protein